jgi:predicted DNA-binding protein YlxM (UPF0122 family)
MFTWFYLVDIVTMTEIARNIGVGTSAVAMALKRKEAEE